MVSEELKPIPYNIWGLQVIWEGKLTLLKRLRIRLSIKKMKRKYIDLWDYLEKTGQSLSQEKEI